MSKSLKNYITISVGATRHIELFIIDIYPGNSSKIHSATTATCIHACSLEFANGFSRGCYERRSPGHRVIF